jgi:hypothetical protein
MAPSNPRGQVKGVSFVAVKRFVEQRGPSKWEPIVDSLSRADAELVRSALAMGWYRTETYESLIVAVDRELGDGKLGILGDFGRFQAEHDLNLFYRIVLRFWSPAVLVEKTAEMWGKYHDTGAWEVRRDGDHHVAAFLGQWLGASEIMCAGVVSYVTRLFELVGAKGVHTQHPECVTRGASRCQFVVDWS